MCTLPGGEDILVAAGRPEELMDEVVEDDHPFELETVEILKGGGERGGGWSTTSSLALPRSGAVAIPLPDGALVAGGGGRFALYDAAEKYSVEEEKWKMCCSMHEARMGPVGCFLNGRAIVAGGYTVDDGGRSQEILSSVEAYDEEEDVWEFLPPMQVGRCFAVGVVNEEGLYVSGGYDGLGKWIQSSEFFSFENKRWLFVEPGAGPAELAMLDRWKVGGSALHL